MITVHLKYFCVTVWHLPAQWDDDFLCSWLHDGPVRMGHGANAGTDGTAGCNTTILDQVSMLSASTLRVKGYGCTRIEFNLCTQSVIECLRRESGYRVIDHGRLQVQPPPHGNHGTPCLLRSLPLCLFRSHRQRGICVLLRTYYCRVSRWASPQTAVDRDWLESILIGAVVIGDIQTYLSKLALYNTVAIVNTV